MARKPKAILFGKLDHAQKTWDALSDIADLIVPQSTNREDFIKECKDGKLDGVVAAYRTFASVSITGYWDEELVNALPKSMLFVCNNGAGYDQVDPHVCAARDPPLILSNVPTAPDDATADANMFLILGALRNFNHAMFTLREKQWRGNPPIPLGHDPQGKVLGILGMGGIGRNLKAKAEAFGMSVIYHNRRKLSGELAGGAKYVEFDELLKSSDVISLNLPLNKNTRHIISARELGLMKSTSILTNTARGAVIDEAALVEALNNDNIASAGLDVFEEEPKIHQGLVDNPKVMLLPHMGTWTYETQTKMEEWSIGNVRLGIEEGSSRSVVPEQADIADVHRKK